MAVILAFPTGVALAAPPRGGAGPCRVMRLPVGEGMPLAPAAPSAPVQPGPHSAGHTVHSRKAMLAKIHMALAELTCKLEYFDDDFYRDELERRFGKRSAADLSIAELDAVLRWLSSLGWQTKKRRSRRTAPKELFHDDTGKDRTALMQKIEAMLAEKGRVEGTDVPWGYAVAILKKKSLGMAKSFKDAAPQHLSMVIAALYKDAIRKGRKVR